ncbi:MAG: hypothetical protein ACRDQY_00050 [Pseudonocardiaceae bacterium]
MPDSLSATTILAGRRLGCPVPLPAPGGPPDPLLLWWEIGGCGAAAVAVGTLPWRWATCTCCTPPPSTSPARERTPGRCAVQPIPADGLTLTHGPARTLCITCVTGIPTGMPGPQPGGTAP